MTTAELHREGASRRAGAAASTAYPWIPVLFLIGLVIPLSISLGPVRLSPYRIVLIVALFGAVPRWLSGAAGPVRGFDICIVLAFLWAAMAYFVVHKSTQVIETSGILIIESIGAYLMARTYIRNRTEFEQVMRFFLLLIVLLFPFALYETMTGRPILLEFFNRIGDSFRAITQDKRLGLERVQGVFDHSIPYGAFVSAGLSSVLYLYARPGLSGRRVLLGMIVTASSVFSVSGGALLALFAQIGLYLWDKILKPVPRRWLILGLLMVLAYIVVDLGSNRKPAHVFISYMSFSAVSGYNRILIFNYGMENVWAHPIFGLGLNDWARPGWMGDSFDNFWLLIAMRHGIPAFLLFAGGTIWVMFAVGYRDLKSPEMQQARYAYMFALTGMILTGITVHYWNALFPFFMFMLGNGIWLSYAEDEDAANRRESEKAPDPISRYTRQTEYIRRSDAATLSHGRTRAPSGRGVR
ncbi:O-antigen ligase family protein [Sedimentitalea sp. JM2-8]|uniref:O-antigen ligase family protein n=1 Tax=Sedimentitalea xiamensis TaxID=3050037 RepID=A0ABT7FHG2_9RHOB|nr:O-antigen ligase family protein [Sedimentitalea xiamensis]MDK3074576.1 O-antigen ligase family protein [Sedimentitalea xiamensis]